MDQTTRSRQAPAEPTQNQAIAVEIYDQVYHLRGTDPAYIEHLAAIVDAKMRAVSAHGNTVDSLRVAVLAALNIADELARSASATTPSPAASRIPANPPLPRRQPSPTCSTRSSTTAKSANSSQPHQTIDFP